MHRSRYLCAQRLRNINDDVIIIVTDVIIIVTDRYDLQDFVIVVSQYFCNIIILKYVFKKEEKAFVTQLFLCTNNITNKT